VAPSNAGVDDFLHELWRVRVIADELVRDRLDHTRTAANHVVDQQHGALSVDRDRRMDGFLVAFPEQLSSVGIDHRLHGLILEGSQAAFPVHLVARDGLAIIVLRRATEGKMTMGELLHSGRRPRSRYLPEGQGLVFAVLAGGVRGV
jgi:hypothetical protein